MKVQVFVDYKAKRRDAYPDIGEQLDALWKAIDGYAATLPPETAQMLEQVKSVKTRFPKPK